MKTQFFNSKFLLVASVIIFSLLFSSCGEGNKDLARKNAEKAVAADIKVVTKGALDKLSLGFGSMVMDLTMNSNEQDSLFVAPLMPFVKKELRTMDEKALHQIAKDKTTRYKFIGSTLLKNKDTIVTSVNAKYKAAGALVNAAIEIFETTTNSTK